MTNRGPTSHRHSAEHLDVMDATCGVYNESTSFFDIHSRGAWQVPPAGTRLQLEVS